MKYEWDPAPPTAKQRTVAGLILALLVLTTANLYFDWQLFGPYAKQADVIAVVIMLLFIGFWMPTVKRR